jgi:hypothetical protein
MRLSCFEIGSVSRNIHVGIGSLDPFILQTVAIRKMKVKVLHVMECCVLIRMPRKHKLRTLLSLERHLCAFKRMHFAALSKERPTQSVREIGVVCCDANENQIGVHCDPKMHNF